MSDMDEGIPQKNRSLTEDPEGRRAPLPPPAFPPGSRHHHAWAARDTAGVADALISPDEPLPERSATDRDAGVATGMGDDAHLEPAQFQAEGDPHLLELARKLGTLAQAVRQRGEAGLRTEAHMDRFDATLRAYCVGYLAGKRAEDG